MFPRSAVSRAVEAVAAAPCYGAAVGRDAEGEPVLHCLSWASLLTNDKNKYKKQKTNAVTTLLKK